MRLESSIEPFLPRNFQDAYPWCLVSLLIFGIVAVVIANRRKAAGQRVDFHYIGRNLIAGLSFPISILSILYPISPAIQSLYSPTAVGMSVAVAGIMIAVFSFYSLIK